MKDFKKKERKHRVTKRKSKIQNKKMTRVKKNKKENALLTTKVIFKKKRLRSIEKKEGNGKHN